MSKSKTKRGPAGPEKVSQDGLWRLGTRVPKRLPFDVLEPYEPPNRGDDGQSMPGPEWFVWSNEALHVAGAALQEGMILAVKVSPQEVVPATAAIVQNLCENVWCVFNEAMGCLLLWDHEPGKNRPTAMGT